MGKMGQIRLLGIIEILQKRSRSRHTRGEVTDAQSHEGIHFKMPLQKPLTAVVVKIVRFQGVYRHMISSPQFLHIIAADQKSLVADHLRRLIFHQLVVELL